MDVSDLKSFCARTRLTHLDIQKIEAKYPHSRYIIQDYWNEHFNELKRQRKASMPLKAIKLANSGSKSQCSQSTDEPPKSHVQQLLEEKSFFNLNNKSIKRESMFQKRSKIERLNQSNNRKCVSQLDIGAKRERSVVEEEEIYLEDSIVGTMYEPRKTSAEGLAGSERSENPFVRLKTMPIKKKSKGNKSQRSIRKSRMRSRPDAQTNSNSNTKHNSKGSNSNSNTSKEGKSMSTRKIPKKNKSKSRNRIKEKGKERGKVKAVLREGKGRSKAISKASNKIQALQQMFKGREEKKTKKRFKDSVKKGNVGSLDFDNIGSAFKKKSTQNSEVKMDSSRSSKKKKGSLTAKRPKGSAKRKGKV